MRASLIRIIRNDADIGVYLCGYCCQLTYLVYDGDFKVLAWLPFPSDVILPSNSGHAAK